MAWATSRSTIDGAAGAAVGELFVDPDRRGLGRGGGSGGRPGGPARPAPPADHTRFHSSGRRWRRSRASAISWAPAEGDMPRARANGSGVNAATAGVPSPPSDSSARRAAPPDVSTPVSAVAGWRSAQWAASWSLRNAARRSALFGFGGGFEHAGGVEVADLVLLPDRGAHGSSQASTTDTRWPQNPLSTRGKSIVTTCDLARSSHPRNRHRITERQITIPSTTKATTDHFVL